VPCYLLSYHGYGTWLPNRPRGYVHRGDGILPPDKGMGELYRGNMKQDAVRFNRAIRQQLIDGSIEACEHQQLRCHFIATEPTHIHVPASWIHDRMWQLVRRQIRGNLTRRLNQALKRQEWFSKSPSRKRVKERPHFDYLMTDYLPKHTGLKWTEGKGIFI
jgi:hypothetical protein